MARVAGNRGSDEGDLRHRSGPTALGEDQRLVAVRVGAGGRRPAAAGDHLDVTVTVTAALPYPHLERATAGLRGELRRQLLAAGVVAAPDWFTSR
jgi:hypothetical protein